MIHFVSNTIYSRMDNCTEYPILVLTTSTSEADGLNRNIHYATSHFGFLLFNVINVVCILLFHGILLKSLSRNFLIRMGGIACFLQIFSCLCSIHRYTINDEYGYWAHPSNFFGLIAYAFFNIVIWHVLLNRHRTDLLIKIGSCFWAALSILTWFITRAFWASDDFKYFRLFVAVSTIHQFCAYASFWWEFRKGTIQFPEYVPASKDFVSGTMIAAMVFIILGLIFAASGLIILVYPATGMTFTVMAVVMSLVGEINFKKQYDGDNTSGEDQSLVA